MPSSGVYQPTTVSYEPRPGLLAQTVSASPLKILRRPLAQFALLFTCLLLIALGITMIACGATDYTDTEEHLKELDIKTLETEEREEKIDVGVIIGGVFVTITGFCLLVLYLKVVRNCMFPCYLSKKQGLARQLQNNGGQSIHLNPSTDPLVNHTQYAPVSELPRQDEEERRNLMPDNKDCLSSAEESDRMDPDPRIVLRPGHVEEA